MKRKLCFLSCGLTAAAIFLLIAAIHFSAPPVFSAIVILIAAFAVSVPLQARVIERAFSLVNQLDLVAPQECAGCEELSPLIARMRRRNDAMAKQLTELRFTQAEFAAITDSMREGLLALDKDARILSCNKSALNLLHVDSDSVANHQNVLTIRRDEPFRAAVEQALAGIPNEAILSAQGRHLQLFANPVQESPVQKMNSTRGAILFLLDVTEKEDRERLRREFSANVSHELKTPIMTISGFAEIMANGLADICDMPGFAKKIYSESQRLITLVDDIMMLSKLDEKNLLPKEPVELTSFLQSAAERVQTHADARGVAITTAFASEPLTIPAIKPVLGEMVVNLLDNAIKYNSEGGSVLLETGISNHGVWLAVSDTGLGIPIDEQERVFERFYRVDKSRSAAVPGTGLGLSIVKHGAALHNAKVSLQSDGRSGTRVEVVFFAN
jgi:two-component system phosphate regulon sensor histidine kinase PhoR